MIRKIVLTCLLGGVVSTAAMADLAIDNPVDLVRETTKNIFTKVNENIDEYTADPKLLETIVDTDLMPLIDIRYAARLILGRAGRGIPQEKIDEFGKVMSDQLVSRYAKGLLEYRSEEQLEVLPQRGELNDRLTRVRTRVRLPQGGFTPVDYIFHKTANGWRAFDVIVEGISYVTTYRNQIMPEVQADGIDSVIQRLGSGDLVLSE